MSQNDEICLICLNQAIAIENEKLWKSRVARIQPKCEILEEENEKLQGELYLL